MSSPEGLYEWLALAGALFALLCLLLLIWNAFSLRRVRKAQKLVLAGGQREVGVAEQDRLRRVRGAQHRFGAGGHVAALSVDPAAPDDLRAGRL